MSAIGDGQDVLRLLLLSDSHLGTDLPRHPRVCRRRRGEEFFEAFRTALAPAARGEVDAVLHGGDLFFRSRVHRSIVERCLADLEPVLDTGTPVLVVPGNHERSRLPSPLLWRREGIFLFEAPMVHVFERRGLRLSVGGFPYERGELVRVVPRHLAQMDWGGEGKGVRLLLMHQIVRGMVVGPVDHVFRHGRDVLPEAALPRNVAAVISGHVHRFQILRRSLEGEELAAPVIVPGSTSATSFAEKDETKRFGILEVEVTDDGRGRLRRFRTTRLAKRPMIEHRLEGRFPTEELFKRALMNLFAGFPSDAIVRLDLDGIGDRLRDGVTAEFLRSLAPETMNVELRRPGRGLRGGGVYSQGCPGTSEGEAS